MMIIIRGKVAVYKNREDSEIFLEKEFLNKCKRLVPVIIGNTLDMASMDAILDNLDSKSFDIFSGLADVVKGSRNGLLPSYERKNDSVY